MRVARLRNSASSDSSRNPGPEFFCRSCKACETALGLGCQLASCYEAITSEGSRRRRQKDGPSLLSAAVVNLSLSRRHQACIVSEDLSVTTYREGKKWFVLGSEKFLPGPAWLLLSKIYKSFFLSTLCT